MAVVLIVFLALTTSLLAGRFLGLPWGIVTLLAWALVITTITGLRLTREIETLEHQVETGTETVVSKFVNVGDPIGYVVVTWNKGMGWQDDWDGTVHKTPDAGRAALRDCSEAGHFCILTELRRIPGSEGSQ